MHVHRMKCKVCDKPFYEIVDEEIPNCPNCNADLNKHMPETTHAKKVTIDHKTGNLSYEG